MTQGPLGYQEGSEPMWWWKVAQHLDETQRALVNAMAHNLDDPGPIPVLYDRLREGQAILLEIFRAKGLLPRSAPSHGMGTTEVSMPVIPMPGVPVPVVPGPMHVDGDVIIATQFPAGEPAVPEVDIAATIGGFVGYQFMDPAAASSAPAPSTTADPATTAAPSAEVSAPTVIVLEAPTAPTVTTASEVTPSADPAAGSVGG